MTTNSPLDADRRRQLVDKLIDYGTQLSVATDWSLTLPEDWLTALPLDGDRLQRPVDVRRSGFFRAPVYRSIELVPQPLSKPVLILTDASGLHEPVYLNAVTGAIGRNLTEIGLTDPEPSGP